MTNEMKTKPDEPKDYDAFDMARILRIHHKTALIWGKRGYASLRQDRQPPLLPRRRHLGIQEVGESQ